MDLLGQGAAWLAATRTNYASRPVTYQRGGSSITVRSTPGRTTREVPDSNGLYTTVEIRDEIVNVGDLVIDGAASEPQAGDQIVDDAGVTWLVSAPSVNEAPWRYTDAYRNEFRIHLNKLDDPAEDANAQP